MEKIDWEIHARAFAASAHSKQKRKFTGEPYINHPKRVVELVKQYGGTEYMVCAAWLHDVIEDCEVTEEQLRATFPNEVVDLVVELTEKSKPTDGNRAVRKKIDRDFLATVSPEAQTIKMCDLIDNTSDILENNKSFAKTYLLEKLALLEVMTKGNPVLYIRACNQVNEGLKTLELV